MNQTERQQLREQIAAMWSVETARALGYSGPVAVLDEDRRFADSILALLSDAQQDTRRLDWLDERLHSCNIGGIYNQYTIGFTGEYVPNFERIPLRAAIDAATEGEDKHG